jgi:hypothetical protein
MSTKPKSSDSGTSTLVPETEPRARSLKIETRRGRRYLTVSLHDGRLHSVPLSFYPTLARATPGQRSRWRSIGGGIGFHWALLDFDLPVRGFLEGRREATRSTRTRRKAG